ncbi:hypothetical protein FHG87_008979 [Trinorchestia longiramus]|nr:hypothetical protein FHG87_008979 [Trinorchestia longiramus]
MRAMEREGLREGPRRCLQKPGSEAGTGSVALALFMSGRILLAFADLRSASRTYKCAEIKATAHVLFAQLAALQQPRLRQAEQTYRNQASAEALISPKCGFKILPTSPRSSLERDHQHEKAVEEEGIIHYVYRWKKNLRRQILPSNTHRATTACCAFLRSSCVPSSCLAEHNF